VNVSVVMSGADEAASALIAVGERLRKEFLQGVLEHPTEMVLAESRAHAPVAAADQHLPKRQKAGKLRDKGMGWKLLKSSNGDSVAVGIGFKKAGYYGLFNELGTSRQSARPFIVPAFERLRPQIQAAIGSVLAQSWKGAAGAGFFKPGRL
jgi:HK97 gp10 family phage protein